MRTASSATELRNQITRLLKDRAHHMASLADINATLEEFGIDPNGRKKKRGRPPVPEMMAKPGKVKKSAKTKKSAKAKKFGTATKAAAPKKAASAKRRATPATKATKVPRTAVKRAKRPAGMAAVSALTGDEFILRFLGERGNATTKEIAQHWSKSGRGGKAENNLTKLVRDGKVKRTPLLSKPGSSYSLGVVKAAESQPTA